MEKLKEFGKRCIHWDTQKSFLLQDLKTRDIIFMIGKSVGMVVMASWLYYRSLWAVAILFPLGIWYFRSYMEEWLERGEQQFLVAFKEMIQSLASSLNTGYSVENALRETRKEMLLLYAEGTAIDRELVLMVRQMRLQIPTEQIFEDFSERVKLEDVRNFATVFVMAKRSGGDMLRIIQNSVNQIGDKIDVRREIDTILAAKRYEFRVMSLIPYGIIGYMSLSFPEFMSCLYGNPIGIGVMTLCLAGYVGACELGARITRIAL